MTSPRMTSRPPPTGPGLFTLDLMARDEPSLSKIQVRVDSQLVHLENNYVSLSLAARNLLAVLRYHGDMEVEAEREFKVTLEQDPDNLNAMHSLVHLYRKSGHAELADDMEHRLEAAQQNTSPLAHAQCLAEQAYAISFECFGQDILDVCHVSNSWLQRAMTMASDLKDQLLQHQTPGQERDAILQKIEPSIFEWRLCTVWNLKKAYNRTEEKQAKKILLRQALTTIAELLQSDANPNASLACSYLGHFLWKFAKDPTDLNDDQVVVDLLKQHQWGNFVQDPALCFEQALASNTLTNAARNEAKRLFVDFLSYTRNDESTIRRLSAWLEDSTTDLCSLTRGHLYHGRAWVRTWMVSAEWKTMRPKDKLERLQESVKDYKESLRLRPDFPITTSALAGAYNLIASIYHYMKDSIQEQRYAREAIGILEKELENADRSHHAVIYQELHKAFAHAGVRGRELVQVQRCWLECENPWRADRPLKKLLTHLAEEDRTEDLGVAAATSAAFWVDWACSRGSDGDREKIFRVLQDMAASHIPFASKVCACAEDMRSKGELDIPEGGWLENLRRWVENAPNLTGMQPGGVDRSVQRKIASNWSEFSPLDDVTSRNWKGVAYDVGVVCAPDDVIWFRERVWRHLVRELGMKVQLLPAEGDPTLLSRDFYKVLVVLSASFWPWAQAAGHLTWLGERRWQEGVGLERGDNPSIPHPSDLAVLRQRVRLGQWVELLQSLL